MPTEQEELKLLVTLVDNATPGLKSISEHVSALGGVESKRAHETMRREGNETREVIKKLTGDLGEAYKSLGAFRGGLLAGVGGLALFSFAMAKQIKEIGEYTNKLRDIGQLGKDIGVNPAVIK